MLPPGQPVAQGLQEDVAKQIGLLAGTPVATGLDAHAGGLGKTILYVWNDNQKACIK